ncbi:MAG TPA: nitronate monooxygenase [Polyangiaceae bacterium]|nr:nitronate monooxygenase [Polyangiaceae bacterium]
MTDSLLAWPEIIQGGMGIAVSDYRLARTTSELGCLGVVSGTAIDTVMVRRLGLGDANGDIRRAMAKFPWPDAVSRVLRRYFVPGGKRTDQPFKLVQMPNAVMSSEHLELIVIANFVEITLAKERGGRVGINFLEKIQAPLLPSLLGAILADVDAIFIGAGIPFGIPDVLDRLTRWEPAELRLAVEGTPSEDTPPLRLDPAKLFGPAPFPLNRPKFFAIVSSHVLAKALHKKTHGGVDGYVVEDYRAGGHNAPPRKVIDRSHPDFGPLDEPDFAQMKALGVPFWVAGCRASRTALAEAKNIGARGIQIGTVFAFCDESAIQDHLKRDVLAHARNRRLRVVTDFDASPTGYPFKRIEREGLPEELTALRGRERVCDLGYLRRAVVGSDGAIGYRCPGEPLDSFLAKGGDPADSANKLCLCNQLLATVGLGQTRPSGDELPLLTAGYDLTEIAAVLPPGATRYSARDVLNFVVGPELVRANQARVAHTFSI